MSRRAVMLASLLTALATATATATGCGIGGLYGVPLPGGPDTGDRPYHVVAYFRDVLDLVPQSSVKVNDVGVGKVERIEVAPQGFAAKVTMLVNGEVELPANAGASVRQTSLLGEKFVDLHAPAGEPSRGRLDDGAEIPLERTARSAEVEEVLGALSMLLNGGGIDQVQSIAHELNAALAGNEPKLRALLGDLDTFVGGLDAQRHDITRAIDSLNRLAATLRTQERQLTTALDGLAPGLQVIDEQRAQLVTMLQALERLAGVATDVVNRSRDDLLADLRALQPVLTELVTAGDALPRSFELLLTFPFPDAAVDAIEGDYANLDLQVDLDLRDVLDNLGDSQHPPVPVPGLPPVSSVPIQPPQLPGVPQLPGLPPPPADQGGGNIFDDLVGLLAGGGP